MLPCAKSCVSRILPSLDRVQTFRLFGVDVEYVAFEEFDALRVVSTVSVVTQFVVTLLSVPSVIARFRNALLGTGTDVLLSEL